MTTTGKPTGADGAASGGLRQGTGNRESRSGRGAWRRGSGRWGRRLTRRRPRGPPRIAYSWSAHLAQEYGITDPPLIHNTKVNMGLRPRGLCWHWAEDMEKRLKAEQFRTLEVQRAIATPELPSASTTQPRLVSLPGGTIDDGMVLDPWRNGGRLFWSPTVADTRYHWRPQAEVHAEKRREMVARGEIAVGG